MSVSVASESECQKKHERYMTYDSKLNSKIRLKKRACKAS